MRLVDRFNSNLIKAIKIIWLNYKDLNAILEELSTLTDKKTLLDMYQMATKEPYSFWYINAVAKHVADMFFITFKQNLLIE